MKMKKSMKIGNQNHAPITLKRQLTPGQKFGMLLRFIGLVALIIWLVWSQENMVVSSDYVYKSSKIPKTFVGQKIVYVSDLANTSIDVNGKVSRCDPDIIIVTGALCDSNGRNSNSINTIKKLGDIAPTYVVLNPGEEHETDTISSYAEVLNGKAFTISAPYVDETEFIDKYIGKTIKDQADKGDEEAQSYIEYTKSKLVSDANSYIMLSGMSYDGVHPTIIDDVYNIIGTDKAIFQISALNNVSIFEEVAKTDIDMVFTGGTYGKEGNNSNYIKGNYNLSGTALFLSGGVGTPEEIGGRILNYPQIIEVTLSDGTIKQENPLERLLGMFITDVGTRFDDDEGFHAYVYTYENGQLQ